MRYHPLTVEKWSARKDTKRKWEKKARGQWGMSDASRGFFCFLSGDMPSVFQKLFSWVSLQYEARGKEGKKKRGKKDKMMRARILSFEFVLRTTSALSLSIYVYQEDKSGKRETNWCASNASKFVLEQIFSQAFTNIFIYIYIWVYTYYIYIYVYVRTYMYILIYIYVFMYVHGHTYVFMHIYKYRYIHICIYIYI